MAPTSRSLTAAVDGRLAALRDPSPRCGCPPPHARLPERCARLPPLPPPSLLLPLPMSLLYTLSVDNS